MIVDDEPNARQSLRRLLSLFSGQVTIVGEASDGEEAIRKINRLTPDLVFLDINLGKLDGFQVLERLNTPIPRIIFTTAYDKYAVKAFDVNSIDYLLKPIRPERLGQALRKIRDRQSQPKPDSPTIYNSIDQLLKPIPPEKIGQTVRSLAFEQKHELSELSVIHQALQEIQKIKLQRIQVRIGDSITFVNLSDIAYFSGEDYLTAVFTADSRKHLIETPLYVLETRLPSTEFVRIHRGTIVNVTYISEITRAGGGKMKAILKKPANTQLIVSRSYVRRIKELFHCL